jgi:hypothetical protein
MTKRSTWLGTLAFLLAILAAGCGGGDDNPSDPNDNEGPPDDDGTMTALVDGQAWTGTASTLYARAVPEIPGGYEIGGRFLQGLSTQVMEIRLYNLDATGTYPLGVLATNFGGYATFAVSSGAIWHTSHTGAAGSITLATLSATRIKGTFEFSAAAYPNTPATGTKTVTSGQFDLAIEGTATVVPDNVGCRLDATMNGVPYHASYVAVTHNGDDYVFSTQSNLYNFTFYIPDLTGPGEYPLSFVPPIRTALVLAGSEATVETECCWGANPADTGLLTITSLSEARAAGTFSMTLEPQAGTNSTAPLTIADGTFDVGLVQP